MMKTCTKCRVSQPYDRFSPHKMGLGGVRSLCKTCSVRAVTQYRQTIAGRDVSRRATRKYSKTAGGNELRSEAQRKDYQKNPAKYLLSRAKHRALRHGIVFTIAVDDIHIPEVCPVLGVKMIVAQRAFRETYVGGAENSMSLDRIIPELGYVPGNVAVISWRANRLKGAATLGDLEAIVTWMRSATALALATVSLEAQTAKPSAVLLDGQPVVVAPAAIVKQSAPVVANADPQTDMFAMFERATKAA